jgi:hypothetical protein
LSLHNFVDCIPNVAVKAVIALVQHAVEILEKWLFTKKISSI